MGSIAAAGTQVWRNELLGHMYKAGVHHLTVNLHEGHVVPGRCQGFIDGPWGWHQEGHTRAGRVVTGCGRDEEVVWGEGHHIVGVITALDCLKEG